MKYLAIVLALAACNSNRPTGATTSTAPTAVVQPQYSSSSGSIEKVVKTPEEWRKILTKEEFRVLRENGTERAFSGDLVDNHEHGVFICAACGLPLFASGSKFDSGTGWPSFSIPIAPDRLNMIEDNSGGMERIEIECARCGGHQGHVFPDGPKPTGLRYCINSVSLNFVKE